MTDLDPQPGDWVTIRAKVISRPIPEDVEIELFSRTDQYTVRVRADLCEPALKPIPDEPDEGSVALLEDTGLINRFLLSLPGDLLGKRQGRPSMFIDDAPAHEDTGLRTWWAGLLDSVAHYDILAAGTLDDDAAIIDLTREAWKLRYDFPEAFEPRMDESCGGDLAKVRGWAAKHCGRVLRLAALLHVEQVGPATTAWQGRPCAQRLVSVIGRSSTRNGWHGPL